MNWRRSHRFDPEAAAIMDRHYSRQKVGTPQFVPPGRNVVLVANGPAVWVSLWQYPENVDHDWPESWVCSAFRREGGALASELITQAVAATRHCFGEPPPGGIVTFIDRAKVPPLRTRRGLVWGYCFLRAGWRIVGETRKRGLLVLQQAPAEMPAPHAPASPQRSLWGENSSHTVCA